MMDLEFPEILIVEDTPQDLELTLRALTRANLANKIHVARDGAEALDCLLGEGARLSPRLIMLDLKLPKVDGLEVLRRLKSEERTRTIPIVVLTSSDQHNDVRAAYALGVNSYIVKPVNFERFAQSVRDLGCYWLLLNRAPETKDEA